jgi:hypothetical protein
MNAKLTAPARLCSQCANSIDEHATECPYCKADLFSQFVPPWLKRNESSSKPRIGSDDRGRLLLPAKFLWPAGMLVAAGSAFFVGGYVQRSQISDATQVSQRQLQAKDQMLQSQEAQLAQLRGQLVEGAKQLAEMKAKLEESQKELSVTKERLTVAIRGSDRANRLALASRPGSRASGITAPIPAPTRSSSGPGIYETTRATAVYEGPSASSRAISQIESGTRINVVSSTGDWLEVRSRHGNPPGYVRADDARPIVRAN